MKDFAILFKEGRFVGGQLVTIKYWKIDPGLYPKRDYSTDDLRLGFVAGLKVSKRAVKRNRVKRQMREIVRLLLKEERVKKGYFVLVIAKPGILEKEYKEIESDIYQVFSRAKLLV